MICALKASTLPQCLQIEKEKKKTQEYLFADRNNKNVPMFTHMFVHEQVMKTIWLKAFLLHSQKQRLGLESHELLDCGGFSSLCKGNY